MQQMVQKAERKVLHVAVCDDEAAACGELEKLIAACGRAHGISIETEIFLNGESLLQAFAKNGMPDLLFLDIRLPDADGIAVGETIRQRLGNYQIPLVYISSMQQYAMGLFKNSPFDFLIKPLTMDKVAPVMERFFQSIGAEGSFSFQTGKALCRIPYRDILYFQSQGRQVQLITRQGRKTFYGKLSQAEEALPEGLFLRIHKSCLVNFRYVREFSYIQVTMANGDVLSISRPYRKEVRARLLRPKEE